MPLLNTTNNMKKILMACAASGLMLAAPLTTALANTPTTTVSVTADFMKSKDGTWAGMMKGKMYWYKLDAKAKLWWSMDGKKWSEVKEGMWADKEGRWLKIGDNKLWWSADMGKNWSEVPEWKWEGPKGEWYKFDSNWSLWTNTKM
jgi:hypothetical protein